MRARNRRQVAMLVAAVLATTLLGCGGASAASPQSTADQLTAEDSALRAAIDAWRAAEDPPTAPPPQDVLAHAGTLQDNVRYLTAHPNLTAQVLPLLPARLVPQLQRLTRARRDLLRLSAGSPNRKLKVGQPASLADLVSFYREANRLYGIGWHYLAAINFVETRFGRVKSNSVAGAQGPMQFIPSTWRIYGDGGNIRDPHDAILGAARLLRANGAPARYGPALRAYNPSGLYVDAVTRYAREIAGNAYGIYYLYCWLP
jgi:membrane-bound lytic murein transglycosylase B